MENFTPLSSMAGGALIGLAATLMLLTSGRIAGISGILGGILARWKAESLWRLSFLGGLLLGPASYLLITDSTIEIEPQAAPVLTVLAGLAVGFGTRLGSGCTSGHGICGISRLSARSILATLTFMSAGIATVYVARHLLELF